MKTSFLRFCIAMGLAATFSQAAEKSPPTVPPPNAPTLVVVVVDNLHRSGQPFYDFDRISEEFSKVFTAHEWPVKVTFERFAANTEPHDLELRIFYRGIRDEFGEKVYQGWTTLYDHGVKHDFGIVQGRYWPRPGEPMDDVIRRTFRAGGEQTASLVQPFLAPTANAAPR